MKCLSGKLHTAVRAVTPSFGRLTARTGRLEAGWTLRTAGAGNFACRIAERAVRRAPDGWRRFSMVDLEEGAQETPGQQVQSQPFPPVHIRMLFRIYGPDHEPPAFYLHWMEQFLERRAARADCALSPDGLSGRRISGAAYPPPLTRTLRQPAGLSGRTHALLWKTAWTHAFAMETDRALLYERKAPLEKKEPKKEPQHRLLCTPIRTMWTTSHAAQSAPGEEQANRKTAGPRRPHMAGDWSGPSWPGRMDAPAPWRPEWRAGGMTVGGAAPALYREADMGGVSGSRLPSWTLAAASAAALPPQNARGSLERLFGIAEAQKNLPGGMLYPGRGSALFGPAWARAGGLNGQRYPTLLFEQPEQVGALPAQAGVPMQPDDGRHIRKLFSTGPYAMLQRLLLACVPKLLRPSTAWAKASGRDVAAFIQAANGHRPPPAPLRMGRAGESAQRAGAHVRHPSVFLPQAGWGAVFAQNANPRRLSAPPLKAAGGSSGVRSRLPRAVYGAKAPLPVLSGNITGTPPFEQVESDGGPQAAVRGRMRVPAVLTPGLDSPFSKSFHDAGIPPGFEGIPTGGVSLTGRLAYCGIAGRALFSQKTGSSGLRPQSGMSDGWRPGRDPVWLIDREEAFSPAWMDAPAAVGEPRDAVSLNGSAQALRMGLTRLLSGLGRTPGPVRPICGGLFGHGADRGNQHVPRAQWMPWPRRPAFGESASGQIAPALFAWEAGLAAPLARYRYGTYTDSAGANASGRLEKRWFSSRYSQATARTATGSRKAGFAQSRDRLFSLWTNGTDAGPLILLAGKARVQPTTFLPEGTMSGLQPAALFYRLLLKRLERLTNVPEGLEPEAQRLPVAGERSRSARRAYKRPDAKALPDARRAPVRIRLSERLTKPVKSALPGRETAVESQAGTRRIVLLSGRAPQTPATIMELLSGPGRADRRIFSAAELVLYAPEAADGAGPLLGGEHWMPFGGQPAGRAKKPDARERPDGRPQAVIDRSRAPFSDRGWDELHASRSLRQNCGLLMQARGGPARMSARLAGQTPDLAGAIERRGRIALLTLEQQRAEQTPLSLEMALSGRQGPMRQVFNPSEIVMLNPPAYLGRFGEGSSRPVGRQDWKKVGWSDAPRGTFPAGGQGAAEAQPGGPLPAQTSGERARQAQSFFRARAELARREREEGGIAPAGVPPRLRMPDIAYKERGMAAAGRLSSQAAGRPRSLNTPVRAIRETQVVRQSGQVSEAELSRMADQIYRKLESRISAERRRFGL